jgi:mono/diheme cytochrome c family protein
MRRLALLLAALMLAVPLAACGGGEDETTGAENVETTATTGETDEDTGTEEETTEATTTAEEGEEEAGEGDPANGKQVFASAGCGSCHTLADAGSSGSVGPNLDESKPDYDEAVEKVTNGAGVMPSFKDQLSEQEIKDVASYVSTSAGS